MGVGETEKQLGQIKNGIRGYPFSNLFTTKKKKKESMEIPTITSAVSDCI